MPLFGKRRRERTIYFPWEKRGVLRALQLPRRRATMWLLLVLSVVLVFWIVSRDRRHRLVRVTRATISHTRDALDAYRADHGGRCPRDLAELTAPADRPAYLGSVPLDAWQRPLRFVCPSGQPSRDYDLLSDGPDGEPYGLDRVE